jgi:putative FmdB family regulatory protein
MPTYEYECAKCEHRFERFQGIKDPPVKVCPKCRSRRVRRLIGTGAGILFKGSGFYGTDYRSESYQRSAKAESEGASSGKESKPETGAATPEGAKKTPSAKEKKASAGKTTAKARGGKAS